MTLQNTRILLVGGGARTFGAALLVGAAIIVSGTSAARAGTITETYSFDVGNFEIAFGLDPSPLTSLWGSFTITFDPTQSYTDDTADIVTNALSFAPDSPIGFTLTPGDGTRPAKLDIGGVGNGADVVLLNTNDLGIAIEFFAPDAPFIARCDDPFYTSGCANLDGTDALVAGYVDTSEPGGFWLASTGDVSRVPEPNTLLLFGSWLAGLGVFGRRGKKR